MPVQPEAHDSDPAEWQCRPLRSARGVCRLPTRDHTQFRRGVSHNFEIFEPPDFIAEATQHISEHGAQTAGYYGWYWNKARGRHAKAAEATKAQQSVGIEPPTTAESDTPYRKLCRMRWSGARNVAVP